MKLPAMAVAALLLAGTPSYAGPEDVPACVPRQLGAKAGFLALTRGNSLVAVRAVSKDGRAIIAFPKGGTAHVPAASLARAVGSMGGLRKGDLVTEHEGGPAVLEVRHVFANCKALVHLPRGGGLVLDISRLRRKRD